MEDNKILQNAIKTPDGTLVFSRSVHDYKTHKDKNGEMYSVDGGTNYLKRSFPTVELTFWDKVKLFFGMYKNKYDYTDISISENTLLSVARENLHRGSNGKKGNEPFSWTPLKDMDTEWVKAAIKYNKKYNLSDSFVTKLYKAELKYRTLYSFRKKNGKNFLLKTVKDIL